MMKKITLLLLVGFFSHSFTNAAIVYTDVSPDFTTTLNATTTYAYNLIAIDFNNDGNKEFDVRWDHYGGSNWFIHLEQVGTGAEMILKGTATNPYGARYIQPLSANHSINSTENWGAGLPEPLFGDGADNNFQGLGDKYVGVKFQIGGQTHYGWILVSFDANKKLTVKEYAYDDSPNTAIVAGAGGSSVGIDESELSSFNLYPNPATDYIIIETENVKKVVIWDNQNRIVLKSSINTGNKINIAQLPPALYYIEIYNENSKSKLRPFIKK